MINEDRTISEYNVLTGGMHQKRMCPACREPLSDHTAKAIDMGGGVEVLVHKACLSALSGELEPKQPAPVRKPVSSKPTMRKATPASKSFLIPEPKAPTSHSSVVKKGYGTITHVEKSQPKPRITPSALGLPDTIALTEDQLFALFTPEQVITFIKSGFISVAQD
jgi:hypothetical protein